ncbi:hypothetical protein JCM10914A_25260 [Paenibacillus sp. JCM 10914]|uniref:hypothetical protein n=1 Tax=Paenibacillus sp. JCM 10914 TaxID=1236974 RepID=UPI0003CCB08A|nr:hypothetical protein [Paenibacillus sp. JCM 10914]GAE09015.1 hypothetical protein JCM10914_5356 [Paenibacillus sp. JCM 10914]
MSLTEWIDEIFGSFDALLAVMLAAAIFSGLYIYSASRLLGARKDSLARIRQTLSIYTRLVGPLSTVINQPSRTAVPEDLLIRLLQECKAADHLSHELRQQIDTFLQDHDESRLTRLHRQLNREIDSLVQERDRLVERLEKPGWGMGLWLLLKPAIPALALAAVILWTALFYRDLQQSASWVDPVIWSLWLSSIVATISFYRLLMDSKRRSHGVIYTFLHLLIVAVTLVNLVWSEAAPYVLTTQLLICLAGFRVNMTRKRRERPYVGHTELLEQFAQPVEEPISEPGSIEADVTSSPLRSK